jgi:hypothetical protein
MASLAEFVRIATSKCLRSELPEHERHRLPESGLGHGEAIVFFEAMPQTDIFVVIAYVPKGFGLKEEN